ncbi:Maf family protein [Anaeroselena agilis]|uniref:dTTP/UTP pyrophosphatase n=1 Tax=Anaeroselena agilis TaxID=3063788 RepID=A0ABU3NZP2_9FIRM|nr:Maf family protein [Selenomonadales bacterium 4137-cl]
MAIILASASPRREELLRQVGCAFTVITSGVEEDNDRGLPPVELAVAHALAKARDVAAKAGPGETVVGADTIVVLDGRVYGKPRDIADARRMLDELAGREHQVITGVAVVKGDKAWTDFAVTAVRFRDYGPETIERYLSGGEPLGKAGAYAIQGAGALLVEGITGCYANVVGLPLVMLDKLLSRAVGVGLL